MDDLSIGELRVVAFGHMDALGIIDYFFHRDLYIM